jgi:uncharacterized protein YoxC
VVSKAARAVDPEVSALTAQVRSIVGQAYRLTQDIDKTIEDLDQYVHRVQPRQKDEGNV